MVKETPNARHTEQEGAGKPPFESTLHIDTGKLGSKGLHGEDTGNDTLVIAEEETTERREL